MSASPPPLSLPVPPPPAHNPTKPAWLSNPSYTHLVTHNPNLLSLFHSCESPRQLRQIHGHLIATGLSRRQYPLSTLFEFAAVSSSGDLRHALRLFRTLDPPTLFSYNTIIRALSASPSPDRAVEFFLEMLHVGITPNKYTYPFVLRSLSAVGVGPGTGRTVHGHAVKLGFNLDPYVESSLVRFYSNCGGVDCAWKLFDRSPQRKVVCWSAMVSGCVQEGLFKEALELFSEFQHEQLEPNESLLVSVLCASAHMGGLERGRWVHAYSKRKDAPLSINLGTALVDMYCKCGVVEEAQLVFEQMPERNVLSWTALISGLAMNGASRRALDKFAEMVQVGIKPDSVTFIGVLNACSHGGLVDEAHKYFSDMSRVYQIKPQVEHYGCMVDLLGRAGMLKEALDLIKSMKNEPDVVIWAALLNACNVHENVEIGEFVGRHLIKLDPLNDANHVLLSNLYCRACRWGDAAEVRKIMKEKGIRKNPGCSVIEVDGVVHEFFRSDETEQRLKEVKPMLDEMSKRLRFMGYSQDISAILLDIDEEEKRRVLCYHSEKLAIAFGLMNVDPAVPIRIVKNLRACVDCHSATKLISKAFNREIIVRDRLRFHHFKDGMCSCSDYW